MDVAPVRVDGGAPTGATVIQVDAGGRKQTAWHPGANHRLSVADVRAAEEAIARGSALLAFLEVPLECVREAVRLDRKEAEVLTGVPVHDADTARRAAERLLARGAGAVMVEAGSAGNLLLWRGGNRMLPLLPVRTVDTTGAGDACSAALAVYLGAGAALQEAGLFANAAAALATTRLGAQAAVPDAEDVRTFLSRAQSQASTR